MPTVKKIVVENVNVPGYTASVNAEKYEAMRGVLLEVLPKSAPGISQQEMLLAAMPLLPQALWPNGEKAGWWAKTVQLDLEAKGVVRRDTSAKPLRWYLG